MDYSTASSSLASSSVEYKQPAALFFFDTDAPAPTAFAYNASAYENRVVVLPLAGITFAAIIANAALFAYIIYHRLYHNFISSHFIAHMCITNIFSLSVLVPLFLLNVWHGKNFLWENNNAMCRVQTFLMCATWSVVHFTTLCVAGVHLLTFARIHYDQLFGLPPNYLCALTWVVGFAVSLPCITNGHIVVYDPAMHHCLWGNTEYSYKFLTYLLILCVIIPSLLSYYAYIKVLMILYHSPIVFQSIGLYKSRFLVYGFLLGPFYQVPFFFVTISGTWRFDPHSLLPVLSMYLGYMPSVVAPLLYGLSLVQMKEEDMALTARAHKNTNAYHHQSFQVPGHNI